MATITLDTDVFSYITGNNRSKALPYLALVTHNRRHFQNIPGLNIISEAP